MSVNFWILLNLAAAAVSLATGWLFWQRRREDEWAGPAGALALAIAIWAFSQGMELASPTLPGKIFWGKTAFLGKVWLAPVWLAISLLRSNWRSRLTRRLLLGISAIPLFTILLAFTNEWHRLIWATTEINTDTPIPFLSVTFGAGFWVFIIYTLLLLFLSGILFADTYRRAPRFYRRQSVILLLVFLIPFVPSMIRLAGFTNLIPAEITPLALTVSLVLMAWFALGTSLFRVMPAPRRTMLSRLDVGILALDQENRLLEINPAALAILGLDGDKYLGQPIDRLNANPALQPVWEAATAVNREISLTVNGAQHFYNVGVALWQGERGRVYGRFITFTDITARKEAEAVVQRQNIFLNTIIGSLANPFYVINTADYSIEIANDAARSLGIAERNTCYALTHRRETPCDGLEHPCPLAVMRHSREPVTVEHIHYDAAGRPRHMEVHAYPVFDDAGAVVQMIEYSLDITERKQVETQLRQLSRAVEQSGSSIIITNLDGIIEFVNPAFTRVTGYTPEEITGKNPRILKSGRQSEEIYRELWQTISRGDVWQGELLNKKKNGELYWAHATISPVKDSSGAVNSYLAIEEDVTRQKEALAALEDRERRLRLITDNISDLIVQVNRQGILQYASPSTLRVLGYPQEAVVGKSIFRFVHAEDRRALSRQFMEDMAGRRENLYEFRLRCKNGRCKIISARGNLITDKDDRIIGAVFGGRDVTERRRLETRLQEAYAAQEKRLKEMTGLNELLQALSRASDLRAALELATRALAELFDTFQCSITLLNETKDALIVAAQYSSRPDQPSVVGAVIPLQDNARTRQVIDTGKPVYVPDAPNDPLTAPETRRLLQKAGVYSHMILPLLARGELIGTIGIDIDRPDKHFTPDDVRLAEIVTGQIASVIANARLLDEREEAVRAAEAANKAKSAFLASMSHELRTPMNAILGFAQLLQRDPDLTENQREKLSTIARSGKHLLTLINDILEMSRIEAGQTRVNPDDFALPALLDNVVSMLSVRAEEKGLQLSLKLPPDLPHYVRTDESKLRQILINLTSNAIKFTETGGVTLAVERRPAQKQHVTGLLPVGQEQLCTLVFSVTDTGIGLSPEDQERIFQPFAQTERGRRQQGTGLGLAISRHFADLLGGSLQVDSAPGAGSTFTFDIQAAIVENAVLPDVPAPVASLAPGQPAYRILIVEDNPTNLRLLEEALRVVGMTTRGAADGRTGVNLARAWRPHLVIMDVTLPGMDGLEATWRIKAGIPHTPVIILTARAFAQDREAAFAAGCDAFMTKPVDMAALFQQIGRLTGAQFVYETDEAESRETAALLAPERLAGLPPEIRQALYKAAVIADRQGVNRLIDQIQAEDSSLAEALRDLARAFQFDRLAALVENDAR